MSDKGFYMEVLEELKQDFSCVPSIDFTNNGKSKITLTSQWRGKTKGIDRVIVYLSGTDPNTGRPISENIFKVEFSAFNVVGVSDSLSYDGDFELHYDAILSNGERRTEVIQPTPLKLTTWAGGPTITYDFIDGPKGWRGVEIESPCWGKCNGKLWIQFDGHTQLVPDFKSNTVQVFLPSTTKNVSVLTADPSLPLPQRKKRGL